MPPCGGAPSMRGHYHLEVARISQKSICRVERNVREPPLVNEFAKRKTDSLVNFIALYECCKASARYVLVGLHLDGQRHTATLNEEIHLALGLFAISRPIIRHHARRFKLLADILLSIHTLIFRKQPITLYDDVSIEPCCGTKQTYIKQIELEIRFVSITRQRDSRF